MEAVLDAHAQMASFFSPLRKANCMNSGLCTPPWSPELDGFRKRNGPGLHLSKFLRIGDKHSSRRSRRATNGTTPPGPCAECVSKSPFRAVTEMKEPFPLMLPDSPALTDKSSHDEEKQRLRRISASYMDLRALAQVQTLPSTSRLNTPLLPSPMFIPGEGNTEAGSCFAYPKRRDTPLPCEEEEKDVPYEVQHRIISGYCTKERWSLLLDEVRQSKQASQLRHASSPWKQNQTSSTSPQPLKPSPKQGKRDRTCSTESDWFANTMSHEARVRRFKQRCFQVVQHPTDLIVARKDNEDQIMLATVLVGPGKPKLVEIQRPSFGSRSSRSTASQAGTMTEEEEEEEEEEENRPSTPVQGQNEVSAFSPYDTPCRRTFGAMIPVMQLVNSSDSVQKLRPAPLTVTPCSTRHPRVDSAVYVHENKAENHPVASNDSQHTLNSYTSSVAWPIPRRPTTRSKSDSRLRQRKLETALDMITSAIDLFPSSLLHLESPTVRQLRNTHISSHIYVIPLQKIFPTASPLLLSAMAAWCLVDVYLGSHEVQRDTLSAEERYHDICAASNESLHKIPDKARRMLGIRSPEENGWESQERRLKQRSQFVRISVGVIAQRLMEAVRGGWVEELWRAVGVIVQAVDAGGYEVGEEEEEEEEEEEWL